MCLRIVTEPKIKDILSFFEDVLHSMLMCDMNDDDGTHYTPRAHDDMH